eukprot:CAMPEP_0194415710 /NCGR_PEP_ID=MMETSP0176-20130528/14515_1 /TAXON_ID=216777 /ORGANISM="Proboscia alata, Strain PI-D3" /LENGTH=131 /DNA_ID=CAMNT_0039220517 /DNA_START=129 /DNA_END=521 /DNA_ORIENTATION=+
MAQKEEGEKQEKGRASETISLLIDPSFLQKLTPKQRLEAITSAEVAARAENFAEGIALSQALEKKRKEREEFRKREAETSEKLSNQLRKKIKTRMAMQGMKIKLYQIDQQQIAEAMICEQETEHYHELCTW